MKNNKPKMSRKERERRMLAEMDAAFLEQKFPETHENKSVDAQNMTVGRETKKKMPPKEKNGEKQLHCPRCKSVMEDGKCPTCGHYIYVPMDKEKRNKIRLIVGGVCIVGFVILFVLTQLKK